MCWFKFVLFISCVVSYSGFLGLAVPIPGEKSAILLIRNKRNPQLLSGLFGGERKDVSLGFSAQAGIANQPSAAVPSLLTGIKDIASGVRNIVGAAINTIPKPVIGFAANLQASNQAVFGSNFPFQNEQNQQSNEGFQFHQQPQNQQGNGFPFQNGQNQQSGNIFPFNQQPQNQNGFNELASQRPMGDKVTEKYPHYEKPQHGTQKNTGNIHAYTKDNFPVILLEENEIR